MSQQAVSTLPHLRLKIASTLKHFDFVRVYIRLAEVFADPRDATTLAYLR